MSDDYIIEKIQRPEEDENSEKTYYRSVHFQQGPLNWKTKLKLWAFLLGGIAAGVVFFLFFLTLFIYLFIPAVILFALWSFLNRRR